MSNSTTDATRARRRRAPAWAAGATLCGAAALVALTAGPASAEFKLHPQSCEKRADIVSKLKTKYGEVRRGAGLESETGVVELYVAKSGSWTLLVTLPNGLSCPVAVGEAWQEDEEALKSLDQPV